MSRFTPRDDPQAQQFWVEGMTVELERCDAHTVELRGITLDTAGTIMCEVSTEAPRFKTAEASSDLTVVQPPLSGPELSPRPVKGQRFMPGDLLEVNCTSPPSRPQAKLRYFINDQMDDGSHTVEHRNIGRGELVRQRGLICSHWDNCRRPDQPHPQSVHPPDQGTLPGRGAEAQVPGCHILRVGPDHHGALPRHRCTLNTPRPNFLKIYLISSFKIFHS